MKIGLLLAALFLLAGTGCQQFVNNVESSRYDSTPSGLNDLQDSQVQEFSEGGQLNATEQEAMEESISGPGH